MESAGPGTNTMQLNGVVFASAGSFKFDRYGDWKESYGNGGSNIPVAAGTWDIKFFTDTKKWSVSAVQAPASYHLRGTHNGWVEGSLMVRVGTSDNYELCVNFTDGDANGGPRFKIDPNGGWGDAIPAADYAVAVGWLRVLFNSSSKTISTQQGLAANCATQASSLATSSSVAQSSQAKSSAQASSVSASIYHLRGTFNSWVEGTLMSRVGTSDNYESCVNFAAGDSNGGPRFKVDPNGGWGDAVPGADYPVAAGWVKIMFNSVSKTIGTQQNLLANCIQTETLSSSSSSVQVAQSSQANSSIAPSSIYHLRGTFNSWVEGTLMGRIGTTDNYESCVNFVAGDNNGGPRFKVDPNGGWGDAVPAADYVVAAGWVKITFNSGSKSVSTQQNLAANCAAQASSQAIASSSVAPSSQAKSSQQSSSVPASIYHLRGTFNGWMEGTLMTRIGTTDNYESCINFTSGDGNGGPRFKVDPNGGWGDAVPAADFTVSAGWVKITYNSLSKSVAAQQNLAANCIPMPTASSAASSSVASGGGGGGAYHIRGTFNNWLEGTLMQRIGTTDNYQYCVNFAGASNRFKVDPNGGWGDSVPAADYVVSAGWVNVVFNSANKSISVQQNLTANCGLASSSSSSVYNPTAYRFEPEAVYHVRGDFNGWAEGALLMQIVFPDRAHLYQACVNFPKIQQRLRIDKNGGWGVDVLPIEMDADFMGDGWTLIEYNRLTGVIKLIGGLSERCVDNKNVGGQQFPSPPDVGVPAPPLPIRDFVPIHIRGTHNGFTEGTLMTQIGRTDSYTACVQFVTGDANGGPRFRVDPNGGWGDAVSDIEVNVPAGWVAISYNTTTKKIGKRANMSPDCKTDTYHIMGTQRMLEDADYPTWLRGDFFELVDGNPEMWKICRYFGYEGDAYGGPRFRVVANLGGTSDTESSLNGPPTLTASGWTAITFAPPASDADRAISTRPEFISVTKDMAPNCSGP